jgi:hypothetical protein
MKSAAAKLLLLPPWAMRWNYSRSVATKFPGKRRANPEKSGRISEPELLVKKALSAGSRRLGKTLKRAAINIHGGFSRQEETSS